MIISQVDPKVLGTFLGMGVKEVTVIGILLVIVIVLGYILKENHKIIRSLHEDILEQQEKRIEEAKEYSEKLNEISMKFMEQTNKFLLVLEIIKDQHK